tara:strand:- start:3604 stop:5391 length:1788 start_codon:yes stop_codon:yes gene_type:complete
MPDGVSVSDCIVALGPHLDPLTVPARGECPGSQRDAVRRLAFFGKESNQNASASIARVPALATSASASKGPSTNYLLHRVAPLKGGASDGASEAYQFLECSNDDDAEYGEEEDVVCMGLFMFRHALSGILGDVPAIVVRRQRPPAGRNTTTLLLIVRLVSLACEERDLLSTDAPHGLDLCPSSIGQLTPAAARAKWRDVLTSAESSSSLTRHAGVQRLVSCSQSYAVLRSGIAAFLRLRDPASAREAEQCRVFEEQLRRSGRLPSLWRRAAAGNAAAAGAGNEAGNEANESFVSALFCSDGVEGATDTDTDGETVPEPQQLLPMRASVDVADAILGSSGAAGAGTRADFGYEAKRRELLAKPCDPHAPHAPQPSWVSLDGARELTLAGMLALMTPLRVFSHHIREGESLGTFLEPWLVPGSAENASAIEAVAMNGDADGDVDHIFKAICTHVDGSATACCGTDILLITVQRADERVLSAELVSNERVLQVSLLDGVPRLLLMGSVLPVVAYVRQQHRTSGQGRSSSESAKRKRLDEGGSSRRLCALCVDGVARGRNWRVVPPQQQPPPQPPQQPPSVAVRLEDALAKYRSSNGCR